MAHRLGGHERARHLPLLLLGEAACEQVERIQGLGLELVDCLFEPIHPGVLRAKVGMFIGLHRRERAARSALDRAGRIEAAAHERERVLHTLLGNLPGMAYRCLNEPGYPMAYVSEGVLLLTGYGPEDFTARRVLWEELIHPDDAAQVWDDIQAAITARTSFTLTYRLRTRTGEERSAAAWRPSSSSCRAGCSSPKPPRDGCCTPMPRPSSSSAAPCFRSRA